MTIHLEETYLDLVRKILQVFAPGYTVWAFGSRVHGRKLRKFSDLDLCIVTDIPVPDTVYYDLKDALSNSRLPIFVDVVDWAKTSPEFRRVIEEEHEVVI